MTYGCDGVLTEDTEGHCVIYVHYLTVCVLLVLRFWNTDLVDARDINFEV